MVAFGFHASHEQFAPSQLLRYVQEAEQAGFTRAMCSDHFYPWSVGQGQSGFAWSWLGAALQATSLPLGVVTTPGYRYHPAVLAQAGATLAEMFPGRFWVAVGSGELLNEHITGEAWPPKPERNARLKECAEIMGALWAGGHVTHRGLVTVVDAQLYTRPAQPPPLVGAAITPETAAWLGGWADALITVSQPRQRLRKVVDAFRAGGGEGKPMYLQAHVSYASTMAEAQAAAQAQWRTNVFPSAVLAELPMPEHFDALAATARPELLGEAIRISPDLAQHCAWLEEDIALGFDAIYLHNVGVNQSAFIEAFGGRVLSEFD
ncbi:TIGR03885 family FMN-dependent LLM class oxidoreductase [Chloroflexia bacterium SDU3-3]|nr:TIGR03885 family FMN-dependent LLM class oxidoreductase [Chloroflexia bacterium SDU3-3]